LKPDYPDVLAFPDVSTVQIVPWEPGVAHVIADVYNPDGSPSEESPRTVLKRVIQQFADLGMQPIVGPELEFYVLEHTDKNPTGWQRYGEATGNVYVAGLKGDPENVLLRTLRHLSAFGLEVVAANHEFSSGQFEINLWHSEALDAADRAFRFKSAIQELARQEGQAGHVHGEAVQRRRGSGFHIHFSTWDDAGQPLFDDPKAKRWTLEDGQIGDRRCARPRASARGDQQPDHQLLQAFRPDTLAPWLIDWGL
jgi:glutamine synthetase